MAKKKAAPKAKPAPRKPAARKAPAARPAPRKAGRVTKITTPAQASRIRNQLTSSAAADMPGARGGVVQTQSEIKRDARQAAKERAIADKNKKAIKKEQSKKGPKKKKTGKSSTKGKKTGKAAKKNAGKRTTKVKSRKSSRSTGKRARRKKGK